MMKDLPHTESLDATLEKARSLPNRRAAVAYVEEYLTRCKDCLTCNQLTINEVTIRRCLVQYQLDIMTSRQATYRVLFDAQSDKMEVLYRHGFYSQDGTGTRVRTDMPPGFEEHYRHEEAAADDVSTLLTWHDNEVNELRMFLKFTAFQRYRALLVRKREC